MGHSKRLGRWAAATVLVAVTTIGFGGASASGQTPTTSCDPSSDPYGCVSTTTLAPGVVPTPGCAVSDSTVTVGQRVDVTITDVPDGTSITLSLGGQAVANGSAPSSTTEGYSDVAMSFTVPDLAAGSYQLVATGAAFSVECLSAEGGIQVLAAGATQTPRSAGSGSGTGSGSLARTGAAIGGLLLLAGTLLVGGRVLLGRSRRHA